MKWWSLLGLLLVGSVLPCPAQNVGLGYDVDAPSRLADPTPGDPAPSDAITLRITAIGDVNFNRSSQEVLAEGMNLWDEMFAFDVLTRGLDGVIDGDVNFANVETVLTNRNDFEPPNPDKSYTFRSHPNGLVELIKIGFNLFSLSNNHAYDYGPVGIDETLKCIAELAQSEPIAWAGIGHDFDEAAAPAIFEAKGVRVGLSAIGIGGADEARAGPDIPGVAHLSKYKTALARLRDADVDIRILSIHDGLSGILYPIDRQIIIGREAVGEYGVDVVFGHHTHTVQGIELYGDGVIFYGLGNGIMRGAANMSDRMVDEDLHADFGLLARLDYVMDPPSRKISLKRVEAVPLTDMHQQTRPMSPGDAAARIETLNRISEYPYLETDWNDTCPVADRTTPLVFRTESNAGVYVPE